MHHDLGEAGTAANDYFRYNRVHAKKALKQSQEAILAREST